MDSPRTTLCPGYKHVSTFSPGLSSPKSKSRSDTAALPSEEGAAVEVQVGGEANAQDEEGEESEYEEEIEYVTLDLGNIEPTLVPSSHTYRLIGLDTPTPYLQLSGTILKGRHEDLLGSELIFTDDKNESGDRAKKKSVTHVATTSKRISFKEVRLRPKEGKRGIKVAEDGQGEGEEEEEREGEGLEYADAERDSRMDTMDEDDALEYVDLPVSTSIDPSSSTLRALNEDLETAISGSTSLPATTSIPTSTSTSPPIPAESHIDKGKRKMGEPPRPAEADEIEETVDPAMRIDRLTGISPPPSRVPRKRKAPSKGKQKANDDGDDHMDTSEG